MPLGNILMIKSRVLHFVTLCTCGEFVCEKTHFQTHNACTKYAHFNFGSNCKHPTHQRIAISIDRKRRVVNQQKQNSKNAKTVYDCDGELEHIMVDGSSNGALHWPWHQMVGFSEHTCCQNPCRLVFPRNNQTGRSREARANLQRIHPCNSCGQSF
jgi:hypothetical protein